MTYRGTVKGGVVVLKGADAPPDGTEVTVMPVDNGRIPARAGAKSQSSIRGKMLEFARAAEAKPCDLPADLAANHDHYLHGLPKRR
jgi:hypothetical protein